MACTHNDMDYNPAYEGLKQGSQQQQQRLYDSPQQQQPLYDMVQQMGTLQCDIAPIMNPLSSQRVLESKQVVSTNIHHSNSAGERVKWLIVTILLITSTLLTGIVLFELYTKEMSCSTQVTNTTQMAQDIAQAGCAVSCSNTIDEMILQLLVNNNITTLIDMVSDNTQLLDGTIKNVSTSLQQLTSTQSILEDISNENKATINTILVNVLAQNPTTSSVSSCQDIKNRFPTSPSDYYNINSKLVYCEMGELCGSEGGWTRLAYLDMNIAAVDCPPGFELYQVNEVRACGRPDYIGSCVSIEFPSNGISYTEVCGRVVGYQFGSPDALYTTEDEHIDSPYVDGVSITQGDPRKHVWTLIAGLYSNNTSESNCPCNIPPGIVRPSTMFIGKDYFCESGDPTDGIESILYLNDPLITLGG